MSPEEDRSEASGACLFFAAYRASGDYYVDRNQSDADEFRHELRIGNEYVRRQENRKREVYSSFRFAQRDGVYYDPDDGLPRAVGGVDIGDRMNYTVHGNAVNLAARLEYLNKEYKTHTLVSGDTVSGLTRNFTLASMGDVPIRGRQDPVEVHSLTV